MLVLALVGIVLYYQSILIKSSFLIGKVNHQLYVPSNSDTNSPVSFYYSTSCNECLCYAISSTTDSYVAINCLTDSRICFFYNTYESNYTFQWNASSDLYLFQLPPNPTTVTITTTIISTTITTTIITTTATTSTTTTTSTTSSTPTTTTTTTTSSTPTTTTTTTTSSTSTTATTTTTSSTSTTTTTTTTTSRTTTTSTTSTSTSTLMTTTATQYTSQTTSSGILYSVQNPASFSSNYTYFAYNWVATQSSATLSFIFRHDPGYWLLDDVSAYHGTTQMITNGGFETGDLTGWTYSVSGSCPGNYGGHATFDPSKARSGNYYYSDGCNGKSDNLYQTFSTTVGDTYIVSFWLTNQDCCDPTEIANITIS